MNVVLINPPAERNLEKWDAPEHPNISLAYLTGFLRKNSIPCKVIDSKFEKINLETNGAEQAANIIEKTIKGKKE